MMRQIQQQGQSRSPVVLVIDDNSAIRDMVSWALDLEGYESAVAEEGQEALEWLQSAAREGRYPAVILLDLTMPGMDGFTFLERLHSQWAASVMPQHRPAIVVITAAKGRHDASSLGVEQIVSKPFHVRDLLDVVRVFIPAN